MAWAIVYRNRYDPLKTRLPSRPIFSQPVRQLDQGGMSSSRNRSGRPDDVEWPRLILPSVL